MADRTKTETFFEYMLDGKVLKALSVVEDVQYEIEALPTNHLTDSQRSIVSDIKGIIQLLHKGASHKRSAINKAKQTEIQFANHRFNDLIQEHTRTHPPTDDDQLPEQNNKAKYNAQLYGGAGVVGGSGGVGSVCGAGDYGTDGGKDGHISADLSRSVREEHNQYHTTSPHHGQQRQSETDMIARSKKASYALRHNNPDIVDLNDINRPTKIAEQFSELYDNEWTESFDSLTTAGLKEPDIIQLLLTIVEEAYDFCANEAEHQMQEISAAILDILEYGAPTGKSRKSSLDPSLLLQYRKGIAGNATQRLSEEFFKKKLITLCTAKIRNTEPNRTGRLARYADKVVELTWWMCVQDPPVYMVPSTSKYFDSNCYRAYTRSGATPDFFVWPALRLYREGCILLKGVVQFR